MCIRDRAVGVLETMLLAASLTVLLRLPAPERPEKEAPAPAATALLEPLRNQMCIRDRRRAQHRAQQS